MTFLLICSKVLTCPDFCVVGKQASVPQRCKPPLLQLRSAQYFTLQFHSAQHLWNWLLAEQCKAAPANPSASCGSQTCKSRPGKEPFQSFAGPLLIDFHCAHGNHLSMIQPSLPPWMMPCFACVHTAHQDASQGSMEGHSGMWQEGSSTEGLIWIARGTELQSAALSTSHTVQMQPRWLRVFITALMEKLEGM